MSLLPPFTVLVTRPEPSGQALCELLTLQGCLGVPFPTIAFIPPPNPPQPIATGQYDMLIFISPQAVFASQPLLPKKHVNTKMVAVGGGTQAALWGLGFDAPIVPNEEWGSEGLLKLPEMQHVSDKKILIIRGEGGREILADTLQARGAIISHLIAYQSVLPVRDPHPIYELMKKKQIHAIVCTSNATVNNLVTLLPSMTEQLKSLPLVVVSERINHYANALGFQSIRVADNASHASIIKSVLQIRNTIWQKK